LGRKLKRNTLANNFERELMALRGYVICETCRKPIYEGHIDCTCEKTHPSLGSECTKT
jgi:Zn finger protein HypA/HybF involved in hydrogenase expression